MNGQCHGPEIITLLSFDQCKQQCRIVGVLFACTACAALFLFYSAILYRYERLLMILRGTRRYAFLQVWRKWIFFLLLGNTILFTVACLFTSYGPDLLMANRAALPLELLVLQLTIYIVFFLGLISIGTTDIYCTYSM